MKLNKTPLTTEEKEKKAEEFLNFSDKTTDVPEKKAILIRLPISMLDDLKDISSLTCISVNSICLELLRPAIKKKLKEPEK